MMTVVESSIAEIHVPTANMRLQCPHCDEWVRLQMRNFNFDETAGECWIILTCPFCKTEMAERQQIVPGLRRTFIATSNDVPGRCPCSATKGHWVVGVEGCYITYMTLTGKYSKKFVTEHWSPSALVVLEATNKFDPCSDEDDEAYRIWEVVTGE